MELLANMVQLLAQASSAFPALLRRMQPTKIQTKDIRYEPGITRVLQEVTACLVSRMNSPTKKRCKEPGGLEQA